MYTLLSVIITSGTNSLFAEGLKCNIGIYHNSK